MPTITEQAKGLNEQRIKALQDANAIADKAIAENRGLSAEEKAETERLDTAAAEFAARVALLDERETRERESGIARDAFERQVGSTETGKRERAHADEFRAWASGREKRTFTDDTGKTSNGWEVNIRAAYKEAQLIRQGYSGEELRALLWDTGSIASGVPTLLDRSIYQYLEASMAAWRMPTRKVMTSGGEPLEFPRVNAHGIATQVIAQGTAIGGTDPTFAKLALGAYKYGQLVQVASEVIQDTAFDIVDFVADNIGRAIGRVVNTDLVVGTGTAEPQGLMTAVIVGGVGTVATGGSLITPTYENLVDLVYSVNDEYRSSGRAAFLMRDATAGNLRKLRDGAGGTVGAVLWEPSLTAGMQNGQPDRLLGFPVYTDPNVASLASNARIMAFGDFGAYYIRAVGNPVIERSDEYAFNVDEATFRGKWRVDGDYIDLTAVNLLKQSV